MLTFAGRGYSPEFTAGFEHIARLIASGEQTVQIVAGPDDICAALLADPDCHCRGASVVERDRLASGSLTDLLGLDVREDVTLQLDREMLARLREAFAAGSIRKSCQGCQWSPLCDEIAKNGFSESTMRCIPPAQR